MTDKFKGSDASSRTSVAIIPARGGSKGITRKNLRRIGGRELIARAVDTCVQAAAIDSVVVTTDDEEIASVARGAGAEVVMRPFELASDTASSEASLLHALDVFHQRHGDLPETTVFVQCTSPFIRAEDLDGAVAKLQLSDADTVISVVQSHRFLWRKGADALTGINHAGGPRQRRQELGAEYAETGAFYVMRTDKFVKRRERFMDRTVGFEVPQWTAIEIDSSADLEIAAALSVLDRPREVSMAEVMAVVTDFDGVHTDDCAYVGDDGREQVRVSRSDGMGVAMLREHGIPILILSKERNPVVTQRARKLRVDVRQGVDEKLPVMAEWIELQGVDPRLVAYVGNDVNDLACMNFVGWPIAVSDASPEVLGAARHVLRRRGGYGAVRELCDLLLSECRTRASFLDRTPANRH